MKKSKLIALILGLLLTPLAASTASARPCCQSCEGWDDGEPPIEYDACWSSCYICGGAGSCNSVECSSEYFACVGGSCMFVGAEPFSTDDPLSGGECLNGMTNLDGTVTCLDGAGVG